MTNNQSRGLCFKFLKNLKINIKNTLQNKKHDTGTLFSKAVQEIP